MTPVTACLRTIDHASVLTDTSVAAAVGRALDALEAAYGRASDRIVALEEIFVSRSRGTGGTPFDRFVRVSVQRRQNRLARRSA